MTERRRPSRRGRGQNPDDATSTDALSDGNPYLESAPQAPPTTTTAPEPRSQPDAAPVVSLVPPDAPGGHGMG
ncbi:MAG TPA: hypothetical protein VII66_11745, partial [Gemmatimonadaceae bacterium]